MIHSDILSHDLQKLVNQKYQTNRFYHNASHINDILRLIKSKNLDTVTDLVLEIAAIFHDYVYVVGSDKNEKRSVEAMYDLEHGIFLRDRLSTLSTSTREKFPEEDILKRAEACILATANHFSKEHNTAQYEVKLFLDFDLWDFGTPYYEVFRHNSEQLFLELTASSELVSRNIFELQRKKFLQSVLDSGNVFRLATHRNDKAILNIKEEIKNIDLIYNKGT